MAAKPLPSPELLRQLLRYEPETGKLFWLERPLGTFADETRGKIWNIRFANREAFTAYNGQGYRIACLKGKMLRAHRVAWAIYYGVWPVGFLDHVNQKRDDNRIENLRNADFGINARNASKSLSNRSGQTGVHWNKRARRWRAKIRHGGCEQQLGEFVDFDQAVTARKTAEALLGFSPNHGMQKRVIP